MIEKGLLTTWTKNPADLQRQEETRLCLDAAEWITNLMEAQNLSRADLARRLGCSKGLVSQILNGRHNMTLRTLARVAWALDSRATIGGGPLAGDCAWGGRALRGPHPRYREASAPEVPAFNLAA